jgi:plasmid stabilization system protein ParE
MVEIWLTRDAEDAYTRLQDSAPEQAAAVARAIDAVSDDPGQPLNLPGVRSPEPLRVVESESPRAPVVVYRHTARGERGDWLVVSLMDRDSYWAAMHAERELAGFPPATQRIINTAVGTATAASIYFDGPSGTVSGSARRDWEPQGGEPSAEKEA